MTGAPVVRWAILGASGIASGRVIPAMRAVGHKPMVVVSTSDSRGSAFAVANGIPSHTTDTAAAIARDDVDAVFISTTNDRHRELAELAALAGKHVLSEKPLADTLEDSEAIVRICRDAGVILAVNHQLPGAGTHIAIRELVAGGAIGDVLGIRVAHTGLLPERFHRWRMGDTPGAGVILDTGTHAASAINAILHPLLPMEVAAIAVSQGSWKGRSEDAAMATIRYQGNVLAQTLDAYTMPFAAAGVDVYGSAGSITGAGVLTQDPVGTVHLHDASGTREIVVKDRTDLYQRILLRFALAITGEGSPTVDGEQGLLASRVAFSIRDSARSGASVTI